MMSRSARAASAALLLAMAASASQAFEGVTEARVRVVNGMPRLLVNGRIVPPIAFFFNPEQNAGYREKYQSPQVRLAAGAGVHLHSFWIHAPELSGEEPDYRRIEERLQSFVEDDPEALFILRIWPPPWEGWPEYRRAQEGDFIAYADGTRSRLVTTASPLFWGPSDARLAALIRHLEAGRFGRHILAYHVGGPNSELFPEGFRERGPDVSEANTRGFRDWLRQRYGTDAALAEAWSDPSGRIETAQVPRAEPGRFPMRMERPGEAVRLFYDLPAERAWVDYADYTADLTARRVLAWARLIRRATRGRKLVAFFFGYTYDLVGSFNGHGGIQKALESPDVDILVAPVPYQHRTPGEPAGFMSSVDSVPLHGKLWLNEDDLRTHCLNEADVPAWLHDGTFGERSRSRQETLGLLDRNLGALAAHRAGTWWMDLGGCGAFSDPALWDLLRARLPLLRETIERPRPYRPEVAVIAHDRSKHAIRSDWTGFYQTLIDFRNQVARTGAPVGWYTLGDFLAGRVPRCRAYLFPNAFLLTDEELRGLRRRLERDSALAVWVGAPGIVGEKGLDVARSARLTGVRLRLAPGRQRRVGSGALAGEEWGPELEVAPRLAVDDPLATPLARYADDGLVAAAEAQLGRCRSVFVGGIGVSWRVLARLLESAGVHRWARDGEIVHADGRLLVVHTGRPGPLMLTAPPGARLVPVGAEALGREGERVTVACEAGETVWLRVER